MIIYGAPVVMAEPIDVAGIAPDPEEGPVKGIANPRDLLPRGGPSEGRGGGVGAGIGSTGAAAAVSFFDTKWAKALKVAGELYKTYKGSPVTKVPREPTPIVYQRSPGIGGEPPRLPPELEAVVQMIRGSGSTLSTWFILIVPTPALGSGPYGRCEEPCAG